MELGCGKEEEGVELEGARRRSEGIWLLEDEEERSLIFCRADSMSAVLRTNERVLVVVVVWGSARVGGRRRRRKGKASS